ncbi:GAF domain-containing protein [Williamsia limnetica]|jgi:putative methionine-R-sulfoxide reductase with GAF domain|uniref:GAF domain-containing protein n=1 Tax=Williamsia limnetica TaxID=882452 RepID=A0A318RXF4_WILLI|nr:GAF and ANTAR domain-containing protein [Williamsia limnetica]PYE18113.1 GAF domain-containing protein [Williamsia limnetica]
MTPPNTHLSEQMAAVARLLRSESKDTDTVLRAISKSAVENVPGGEYASVTLVTANAKVETPVMVGDLAGKCDELQQEFGEGPCIRSALTSETIQIDDMGSETRWPRFASGAEGLGIKSMICFCLYIEDDTFGALNLHSSTANAFDDESISIGSLFAAHAAIAFAAVREKDQIRAALTNRDIIGQAKGMIMERYKLAPDDAFRLLARLSQDSNVKLADIALQVVTAGPDER